MIKAGSLTKGISLKWQNEPVVVVGKEFYNPGKGSAVVRLKLKNLKNGKVTKEVLKTDENVEEIQVGHQRAQYLYKTKDHFVFMNPFTYEQLEVNKEIIGEKENYLKDGEEYGLALLEDVPIDLDLPKKMVFVITEAEHAVKGDTVTGATKPVTLENGLVVKVPLFIKEGEKIIINTETGEYIGRQN